MKLRAALMLTAALVLSACDKLADPATLLENPARAPAAQAVLDLAAVAKALGRDEVLKQQLQAAGQQLQQQLSALSTDLQTKLREEQAKLGSTPSEEERQQLQKQLLEAQRQVQQSQLLARQKAAQFQNQLALQFRDEIRPVAAEIARQRGVSAVVLANTLLWFDPRLDITGSVIDAMRAKGAASGAPAPAPAAAVQAPVAPAEEPPKAQ